MANLELVFECGDESLSVRNFRVEEGLNVDFAPFVRLLERDGAARPFVGKITAQTRARHV